MSQIIDPIPQGENDSLLCSYVNATNQIQIARITNVPNWYFERVVFPGQRLVFEAISCGILEIHSGMMASAILSDRIPCARLAIKDESHSIAASSATVNQMGNNANQQAKRDKSTTVKV